MSRGNAARLVVLGAAVAMAVAVLLELRRLVGLRTGGHIYA